MPASVETKTAVQKILLDLSPFLDEKQRRIFYGSAADALGFGGVAFVKEVTGKARNTITAGIEGIGSKPDSRVRKKGGGRKSAAEKNPLLYEKIEEIVRKSTYGDTIEPLFWTTLSLEKIVAKLKELYGITVSRNVVSRALDTLGYSKQQNQKMEQLGSEHPDRDKQFKFINEKAEEFLAAGEPVISIDTKKKENLGNFKNNGAEYRPKDEPEKVLDHDFPLPQLGKVVPYGIYVLNDNTGFVNLGKSHDTAEFRGESIRQWWYHVGAASFPEAKKIYINSDGGGSNSSISWLWKKNLQELADETGLEIHVSHFPPGTSKWNKIEHRLFCYISKNWQGKPLYDIQTVVNLISATTTKKGLKVKCIVDPHTYEKGLTITDEEKEAINIEFCGPNESWNYIIKPSS